jgi:hypothetical protein
MKSIDSIIQISVAMLSLAYPILIQAIARVDEKYDSDKIAKQFKDEKMVRWFTKSIIVSFVAIFVWIINIPPPDYLGNYQDCFENTAGWLILLSAAVSVTLLFKVANQIFTYYSPDSLANYLIDRHKKAGDKNSVIPEISDLLNYSIKTRKQETAKKLRDYLYGVFKGVRKEQAGRPVVYPESYYNLVNRACVELAMVEGGKDLVLENRVTSGIWLIGEGDNSIISERTFIFLWRNLLTAIEFKRDDFILNFWDRSQRYYKDYLPVDKFGKQWRSYAEINGDRKRLFDFHLLVGALLAYHNRYSGLRAIFEYNAKAAKSIKLLNLDIKFVLNLY